jgi:hypothetical protein
MLLNKEIVIMNNELYHYGVLGMKWGVRKAARTQARAARGRRDIALSKATNDAQRKAAKAKYKSERRSIKMDANKKISDINNSPEAIRGRKRATVALKTVGGVAATTAAVAALYPAVAMSWGLVKEFS